LQAPENNVGYCGGQPPTFGTRFALSKLQPAPEVFVLEPTLMVIGLNHRTAPLAMRERFWVSENRRYEVMRQLRRAEGIEEVVVLSTWGRTEFLLWASEPTLAANSLLQFLGSQQGLKLSEWQHFYRVIDDSALIHVFRITAGLDSPILGEPQTISEIKAAWEQARTVGAAGPFLNAILERALAVAKQVRTDSGLGAVTISVPAAALELVQHVFGSSEGRRVLLLGASEITELFARQMVERGAESIVVIDQNPARATELADKLGGSAATLADRWKCMLRADIVITATGCPHVVLSWEEAERIAAERNRVALVILDMGMPRDVDPNVRRVDGILLYDLEGLERALHGRVSERTAAATEAERVLQAEAHAFRSRLKAENVVPTIVALRQRLDEICRQELESFIAERGPFTREQDQSLHAITAQVIQKIASSLVRELKDLPEKEEQEKMTAAVTRLFHLDSPNPALAGTNLEKRKHERSKNLTVAIH
jgi:glutamyl-tRNA reductase